MAVFKGFCGPSYHLTNRYASVERLVNWYCIVNESPEESGWTITLEPCPGNAQLSAAPAPSPFNQPCRGLLECRGVVYGVNGSTVFSIDQSGNFTNIGSVMPDVNPASLVANANGQIFICSGGNGYVIPPLGGAGSLIQMTSGAFLGGTMATFQDGYIIVITPASNQMQISGTDDVPVGDATQWTAANISVMGGQADNLAALMSWREYLYLFGKARTPVLYDAGQAGLGGFPFQSYCDVFVETGIAAPWSLANLGDSLIWIGQDARGLRGCWRMSTFQPMRTSSFAVEQAWQNYSTVRDAIAFAFTWQGHIMYQVTFPTANATWVYDATASQGFGRPLWFERQFTSPLGAQVARPELFHAYCYGKHLVGSGGADGFPGAIYQYSAAATGDWGLSANTGAGVSQPIVRDRIAPHLRDNNNRIIYDRFQLETVRGQGADFGAFPSSPTVMLRWSNDGGNTWGRELQMQTGALGKYATRVFATRLGYGRDRVYWVRCSDPAYWGVLGAELETRECAS